MEITSPERDTFDDALPSDDTFSGVVNGTNAANTDTYQTGDLVDGGNGNDTLHITSDVTTTRTTGEAWIANIETLHITQNSDNHISVYATQFDDKINNLVVDGGSGAEGNISIGTDLPGTQNQKSILDSIELSLGNPASRVYVYYTSDTVSGDNSSEITLTNNILQRLISNGIETYTVHTRTSSQALTITDASNTTIIVEGGGDLELTARFASNITLSSNQTTVIYTDSRQSRLADPDTIDDFDSGTDKINVTAAIESMGGVSTGETILSGNASAAAYTPVEGDPYQLGIGVVGVTRAYQDTTTKYLYIDTNQDNIFNAATDMVIDMGVNVVPDDLIV